MSEKEKKTEELEQETVEVEETLETSADTDEEVQEEVKSDVEVLQEKLEEMEDKFLRASAEIANVTNRNRNEREQLQKYRSQDLGKKLLTSLDNLERAMAIEVSDEQGARLKKGIEMVLESMRHAFKEEGIAFKLLKLVITDDATKAVVMTEDGEICGLFTDSQSAKSALQEVQAVFGDDQPFITVHIKETAKKQSVYYVEVQ